MLRTAATLLSMLQPSPLPVDLVEAPILLQHPKPIPIIKQVELPQPKKMDYAPFAYKPMGTYENPFPKGQCTEGAASMKGNVTWRGNANKWDDAARAKGITVSSMPIVGAIAQTDRGNAGHVGVVTGIDGDMVLITERNYDYHGSVRTEWQPTSDYVYIWL